MKNLLVPTDFSPYSHNALLYSIQIAESIGAKITLLHAHHTPVLHQKEPTENVQDLIDHQNTVSNQNFEQYLKKLQQEFTENTLENIAMEYKLVEGGVVDKIVEITQEQNFDLVIMGTKGASGIRERFFGTNTEKIIDRVKCPVMAIPVKSIFTEIKNVVFATDLKDWSAEAVGSAYDFSQIIDTRLQFAHVVSNQDTSYTESKQYFLSLVSEILGEDFYDFIEIIDNDIFVGLNQYIEENNVGVLAMVQQKGISLNDFFAMGHTKKMAFYGKVPVLIFKE